MEYSLFSFDENEKADERNYHRARRTEEKYVKDIRLEWDDYYDWLDKVRSAKALWLNDGLSDEDFLNIVHELD